MLISIFNNVLYISFMGTIAAILILLTRAVTKDKLSIKFQFAINFILILRLMMSFNIPTSLSIYNYMPTYSSTIMNIPVMLNNYSSSLKINENNAVESISSSILDSNLFLSMSRAGSLIWFLGITIIILYMIAGNIRLSVNLKKADIITDRDILDIFEECRDRAQIKKNVTLIASEQVKSPCVYGFIKPRILVPKMLMSYKDDINFKYIFLHELIHIKKCHILINYIIFILNAIHWFNPIIRLAFNKMKDDMEIVCDSDVLCILTNDENEKYGNSLLDLMEISIRAPWLPQVAGIINNKNKLQRRIKMIKKFNKKSYKLSALALAGLVLIGGSVLTGAKAAKAANAANGTSQNSKVIEDNLDYDFVNDEEVVGKWQAVDFVKNEEDFTAGKKSWKDDLYLQELIFLPDGQMAQPVAEGISSDETTPVKWFKWTKGIVMHYGDKTASSYKIKEINGEKYMIYQWKSGDYTMRGMTPWYYVLKQVK